MTGALAANIAQFGRLLRAAGLPIGAGKAVAAKHNTVWVENWPTGE